MRRISPFLFALVLLQVLCAGVFLWDILASVFGLRSAPIAWQLRELLEIAAALGLLIGTALGLRAMLASRREARAAQDALKIAAGALAQVVEDRFTEWTLTPAEREVAWLSIKGFPMGEIASIRGTAEGTIKAQCGAIYRKAGVSGRAQLLAAFVDDLLIAAEVE